ncbi:kinase-like domain-containing protein [Nemania sp. NC0429]|nr:kinase-like domain-containing protein [Nemania sp. NC0429]
MASYSPVPLPYYAPADELPAPLPTHEDAVSSTTFLKNPYFPTDLVDTCVARVGDHFIAKYGKAVSSIEGENMLFVKQHTNIPVPAVYAIYTFDEDKTMIVMEFIEGVLLNDFRFRNEQSAMFEIASRIRGYVNELRKIPAPSPSYYGSIGRRPFTDFQSGRKFGPFGTFADLVSIAFDTPFPPACSQHLDDKKRFFRANLFITAHASGHSHPVFSHSDIHEENVIVRPDGTPVLIDYQLAGFYPAYHEYVISKELDSAYPFLDEEFPHERQVIEDAIHALIRADYEHQQAEKEKEVVEETGGEDS